MGRCPVEGSAPTFNLLVHATVTSEVLSDDASRWHTLARTKALFSGSIISLHTALHLCEARKALMPLTPPSVAPKRFCAATECL